MPEGALAPEGVIAGGWGYVIAAYTITAVVLLGYAWNLNRRARKAREDEGGT